MLLRLSINMVVTPTENVSVDIHIWTMNEFELVIRAGKFRGRLLLSILTRATWILSNNGHRIS